MKLVMDERVKHRIIGLAVILSIGAIFAPAIMKKSNQRFDNNLSVSVELPPKPEQPNVAMTEKDAMFQTIKVAHADIPEEPEQPQEQALATNLAKAETTKTVEKVSVKPVELELAAPVASKVVSIPKQAKPTPVPIIASAKVAISEAVAKVSIPTIPKIKQAATAKASPAAKPMVVKPLTAKPAVDRPAVAQRSLRRSYAVQLATFAKQANADSLVSKLRSKGYKATYNKVSTSSGMVYKVIVGQIDQREKAQILQQQLATAVQIRGFIVTTGQG